MSDPRDDSADAWDAGWDAHRRRKLTLGLSATPEELIDWLEEMIELAHASGALPRRRSTAGEPEPSKG